MPFKLEIDVLDAAGADHLRKIIRSNPALTPTKFDKSADGKHATLTFEAQQTAECVQKLLQADDAHLRCQVPVKV